MNKYIFLFCCSLWFLTSCKKPVITEAATPNVPYTVFNEGVPGNTVPMLLARIDSVTSKKPDLVIVMIGTNDVSAGGTVFADFGANLSTLVDQLKASGSAVMLLTPPPVPVQNPRYNTSFLYIDSACNVITRVSRIKGCYFVDIHSDLTALMDQNTGISIFLPDELHPNQAGSSYIAGYIYTYMKANNITKKKIVCFGDSITYGYMVNGAGTVQGYSYPAILLADLNKSN